MASTLHATLGASSAHRWMPCPGSIGMSEGMPNESNVFARTGSAAHEIGEMCLRDTVEKHSLRNNKNAIDYLGIELEEWPDIQVDEEMCAAVQEYLDVVRGEIEKYEAAGYDDWELGVEVKFDLSHIYPDMFGTCDAVLYLPAWKKLFVFDYKHGWVSVPVIRNPQTMYYALGAITGRNIPVDMIELVIVQPRSGRRTIDKRWTCDMEELWDFKAILVDSAERTERKDAALNPGEWCKFCPASPVCRVLKNRIMEIIMAKPDPIDGIVMERPERMAFSELKTIWENAPIIEGYIKNVKAYLHQQALDGNLLPGTKMVEGRSNRKWKDAEAAESKLNVLRLTGEIDGDLFITKLKSPKQVEDMLPKKQHKMIEGLWVKGQGALTIVADTDDREEVKKTSAMEIFS